MTPSKPSVPAPEVIQVRDDEGFDEARLAGFLSGRLQGSDGALSVRQFGGGHANLTYLLRFGEGEEAVEYVLRRPPLGPVAPARTTWPASIEHSPGSGGSSRSLPAPTCTATIPR